MSVITKADEELEKARKAADQAVLSLAEIYVNQCWGHDEFKQEFLENAFEQALKLRKVLAR